MKILFKKLAGLTLAASLMVTIAHAEKSALRLLKPRQMNLLRFSSR